MMCVVLLVGGLSALPLARRGAFNQGPQGFPLLVEGFPLVAESFPLLAQGFPLLAESFPLLAQGFLLLAQGSALLAEDFHCLGVLLPRFGMTLGVFGRLPAALVAYEQQAASQHKDLPQPHKARNHHSSSFPIHTPVLQRGRSAWQDVDYAPLIRPAHPTCDSSPRPHIIRQLFEHHLLPRQRGRGQA